MLKEMLLGCCQLGFDSLAMVAGGIVGTEHIVKIKVLMEQVRFQNIMLTPKDNSKEIQNNWLPGERIAGYVASFIIDSI